MLIYKRKLYWDRMIFILYIRLKESCLVLVSYFKRKCFCISWWDSTFELLLHEHVFSSSYFSCTDSDFVDPACLEPVSSVQYLSPPGSLPAPPAVKVSIFPQEIWHVCSFYCQLSNTVSLEQQQVCWSVCWRSNICLKPVVSVFSLSIVFLQSLLFFIASLLLEFSNQGSKTY